MKRVLVISASLLAAAILYLLLWPVPIDPVAWQAPVDRGLVDPFGPDDRLASARGLHLGKHDGPEDVTGGHDGRIYVTTKDGFILQVDSYGNVREFAEVGGRALGIETDLDGTLVTANAYVGLQRISASGAVEIILSEVDGRPLVYADDLAIGADGTIYFSEASTKFGAQTSAGTYEGSLLDIMEHGGHGQIIEFNPGTGAASIILDGLNFANGVAISEDQRYLLIAETGAYRILRFWLEGPARGSVEVVLDNLPAFPDNINNGLNDRFWVGLVSPRNRLLDMLSDKPLIRKIVQRLPGFMRPKATRSSHVIAINGDGEVLMNLQDPAAKFPSLTGVYETRDALYLTALFGDHLPVLKKNDL
jgi:sugar lactone lactonase YvrE